MTDQAESRTNESVHKESESFSVKTTSLVAILFLSLYVASYMMFRSASRADLFNYHAYLADSFLKGSLSL